MAIGLDWTPFKWPTKWLINGGDLITTYPIPGSRSSKYSPKKDPGLNLPFHSTIIFFRGFAIFVKLRGVSIPECNSKCYFSKVRVKNMNYTQKKKLSCEYRV